MSGSAVTPPKGRATRSRNDSAGRRSLLNPKLQWALVILAGLAVLAAVLYAGRDVRSDYNGAGAFGAETFEAASDASMIGEWMPA